MNIPPIELHDARSIAEACALLDQYSPNVRLLAGGTDVLVDLKTGRMSTNHLISIRRIDELHGVTCDDGGLRIGALTTPNQLADSPDVGNGFAPLLDAICEMAAPQVRNMATVGGNIASAIPSADLPPILIAMNASVVLQAGDRQRSMRLESFFRGPRQSAREHGEVLTRIIVPHPPAGFGAAYARFAMREANACAVAGVAASLRLSGDGTIGEARVVLCAVAPTPKLVDSVRDVLAGETPGADAFDKAALAAMAAAEPISDIRGSDSYRREIVGVLTRRALEKSLERARENLR